MNWKKYAGRRRLKPCRSPAPASPWITLATPVRSSGASTSYRSVSSTNRGVSTVVKFFIVVSKCRSLTLA
ncbi:hypothetical protein SDJN02_18499, partial [Cucurbita argyrosperma subsp. argyrosperma]